MGVNKVHLGGKVLKPRIMLVRARTLAIAEEVADQNALVILSTNRWAMLDDAATTLTGIIVRRYYVVGRAWHRRARP